MEEVTIGRRKLEGMGSRGSKEGSTKHLGTTDRAKHQGHEKW